MVNTTFVVGLGPTAATTRFVRTFDTVFESLTADPGGDVVLGGICAGNIDFGTGPTTPVGTNDLFVARLANADGATRFVRRLGGANDESIRGLAVAPDHAIAATGTFLGKVNFGTGPVMGSLQSNGFLVLLDP